jgi:hypothetical protein
MIYLGSNEIAAIKLGNTDISAIYAGDLLIYPTTVTAWSVTPTQIEKASTGGTEQIKIASLSAWTITSSESWITFSQNSGDSGRTTVIATIAANTSTARTATITVTDGTNTSIISVSQSGLAFSVSPVSIDVLSAATTQEITISSPYPWTIVSSESWITFSQDSGSNGTYTVTASIAATTANRTATITVDNGYEYSAIGVTQSTCNPIVCAQHLGNTNNQGYRINNNFYLFDSGLTVVDNCGYDLTGIKSICHRWDGNFYEKVPVISFGNNIHNSNYMGCYATMTDVNLSIPDVEVLHYCFGNDKEGNVTQTLTSVTFTNTDKVTHIGDFCYYNRKLKEVHLGNLSNVTNFESNSFNASNVSLTGFTVDALPNINLNVGWQYCPLSVDSLVSIFNALPTASGSRTVTIGTTNKNKLSAAQLAIATDKGWTVN